MLLAIRRTLVSAFCLAAAVLAAMPVAAGPPAADLRLGDHSGSTRIVIETDQRVSHQLSLLGSPYRVVVDLPEVDWRIASEPKLPLGLITGLRYGLFQPGASRLVLDVGRAVAIDKSFVIEPRQGHGWRLVVDLVPTVPAAFKASQGLDVPVPEPRPDPPPQVRKALDKPMIVIDPGHGGVDPGATGISGIYEKHITLTVAREVRDALLKTGRYRVHLTRNRDVFIALRNRIKIAHDVEADLFISLHADSIANHRIRGGSVYTLSENASDSEAEALAAKENRADALAGVDLSDQSPSVARILIELAQRATKNASVTYARDLIHEMSRSARLLHKTHRFAGFAVLKSPEVPSVLFEMGYLSNRIDEAGLRNPRHRAKLAQGIVKSIDNFFRRQQAAAQP